MWIHSLNQLDDELRALIAADVAVFPHCRSWNTFGGFRQISPFSLKSSAILNHSFSHLKRFRSVEWKLTACHIIELQTLYKFTFGGRTIGRNVVAENAILVQLAAAVHQRHRTCNGVWWTTHIGQDVRLTMASIKRLKMVPTWSRDDWEAIHQRCSSWCFICMKFGADWTSL